MVLYQVQFKPINPTSQKSVTNLNEWKGGTQLTASSDYDCALMFTRKEWPTTSGSGSTNHTGCIENAVTNLVKIPHEIWAVYANADSVKNAMKLAKPLISQYGAGNVQICKIAPSSIEIVFEEAQ